jgi:hypothetical protein
MILKIDFLENKKIKIELTEKEFELLNIASEFIQHNGENKEIILKRDFFSDKRKTPDVFRYTLTFNDKWKLNEHSKASEQFSQFYNKKNHYKFKDREINEAKNNNIVVILESPHTKEYDSDFQAIAPAVGTTGNNFKKYFVKYVLPILNNLGLHLKTNNKYNILFVNPVPYQTSLAQIHNAGMIKNLKIKVWKKLFEVLKNDFKKTINEIEADFIINAATSDVTEEITKIFKDTTVFEVSHPSSWHFLKSFQKKQGEK